MRFSVLASGSNGNAVFIEYRDTRLLLDAGISGKQLKLRMEAQSKYSLSDITGVLVTHEHDDHIRGLAQVFKHAPCSAYMTEGTHASLSEKLKPETAGRQVQFIREDTPFDIGDIHITPFAVSHDAEQPVAYRFDTPDGCLAVVTDLGYVTDHQKTLLQNCDAYVFESNHDVDMLRAGRYPWHLKRRILGDKGHLSNVDAAYALIDILPQRSVDVYLAHLSGDNNHPDLADITVTSILKDARPEVASHWKVKRTSRSEPTPFVEIASKHQIV